MSALPLELWRHIATFIDELDDVRVFCSLNSALRECGLGRLYETLAIGTQKRVTVLDDGEVDQDALDRLKLVVRDMIDTLSRQPGLVRLVRKIRLCEYSWFERQDFDRLTDILKQCQHQLEHFEISLNSDTAELTYAEHIQPFWQHLVNNTPNLKLLSCRGGPNVALDLGRTRIRQLDVSGYSFEAADDGPLPLSLKAINFVYVTGITPSLFRPELFDSLEVLLLRSVGFRESVDMTTIVNAYKRDYPQRQSALKSLSISINPAFLGGGATLLFLSSFAPSSTFVNLTTIEILSMFVDETALDRAYTLCDRLPSLFPQAVDLTVLLGVFESGLLSLQIASKKVIDFALCFKPMRNLRYLTMNIIDGLEPNRKEATTFFSAIPSLQHVSFRGSAPVRDHGGVGFEVRRKSSACSPRIDATKFEDDVHANLDDESFIGQEVLDVTECGVRTLLGE
ncbi:hypothetical protein ACM66B_004092 [Microbotryomycetes sp. NB124-2]